MLTSDLYIAVMKNDERGISRAITNLYPGLISYLRATLGGCHDDCQESVQLTMIQTVSSLKSGKIRDPERLMSYMMRTARNNFIRQRRRDQIHVYDDSSAYSTTLSEQTDHLVDADDQRILLECLDELDPFNKTFIEYWLQNPGIRAEEVAEEFGFSVNATWQRKHRLIKALRRCAEKKNC